MLSEVHLGENVFREGSSGEDCNGHIPKLLQSDQAGVLYDVKNDECPKSMIVRDFSGGHIMEESCDVQLSSRLEDLSVSQKHSDLTCIGDHDMMKNVDEQDLSEADCREHLPAIDHHFAEKLSGSVNLLDLAYMNNADLSYNVIRKHDSGAGLCDHFTPIENLSAPEQFPALLCYQNDYLSQHLDTPDWSVVDSGNGSSVVDLTSAAQMLSVSTELSEPSSSGNYDLSDSMRGQHYSRSGSPLVTLAAISIENHSEQNQNGRTDPIDFDGDQTTTVPDAISPSQRRRSFRKTMSRQDTETVKCKRNGWRAGKVSFDLDLLQIMRRRRSCSGKRAHASSWGLHSNLELDERPSTSRGQSSGKLVKSHPKNHHGKVRRKRSHITDDIPVKSKLGVGVDSNSTMDVSNERPFEILGKTPGLSEVEEPTKSILSLGFQENLKRILHVSDDTTYNVGKNFVENISNLGSDLGTSPDSEVINLNPDTGLWGNTEEEFHNIPCSSNACLASDGATCVVPKNSEILQKQIFMGGCSAGDKPMESGIVDNDRQFTERGEIAVDVPYIINASASSSSEFLAEKTSSTEQKSEEQSSSTLADIGSPCVPSADIGTELTPRAGFDLQSPVVEVSAKVHSHSKGQKILKGKKKDKVRKSRSEFRVSANKGQRKSKKKANQDKLASKHKIKVNLRGGQTSSEAERQAGTGNSKLAGLGESGTAKSSLAGDVSTSNVGFTEKSEKPRNAWVLCDDCQKWRRISAILADHIDEANRSWTCKDNVDKNFGNCSIPQEKSDAEINTELGISDASCDEGVGDARANSNNLVETQSRVAQQSTWKLIKSNQFLHRKKQTQTIDEIMVCHCKPLSDGGMGCGDGCLNRMLNIECIQGTCPCGELCSNQQFQKRNYAKLEMFKCGKKGYGIQVLENISEGQFLIEYVGEVLDMHSYEARQRDYAMQGHKHFYFMTLNGSEVIDACAKGNLGRFINHSCDPNCRTEKWMVNGEVCVGLFALKNIKKGEELTFDYNYVRVFGAAAKKCVCGSSQCRGYIGGNPENTEVVEDDSEDDYPEPVMVCKNGAVDESYPDMTSPLSTFGGIGIINEEEPEKAVDVSRPLDFGTSLQDVESGIEKVNYELTSVVDHEDAIEERLDPLNTYMSTDVKGGTSEKTEDLSETLDQAKAVLKHDDISGETLITGKPEYVESGEKMNHSRCLTLEENSASVKLNQMPPYVIDSKRKPKSGLGKGSIKFPVPKASRLASSIKNGKSKSTPVNVHKVKEVQGKNDVPFCKPKKEVEVSTTGRFEAVQEKLNELLNPDGGISKRKDASKGYLKLLLLTAASGDSCNGEAIQSNRYLSMILGALLETKSRTVLVDIINKNGLQMLHNMLKRSRKEFNKIPILRKLLKVFEYLATREILTPEHISGGPTCPGVESFRESILSLTEHIDKQVHQIARNFRDRWIPRSARRHQGEECKKVFPSSSEFCRNSTHNQLSNQTEKCLETPDYVTKSVLTPTAYDTVIGEGSRHSSGSGRNTRKRKSRWDQPGDLNRVDNHMADDGTNGIDDDLPPGFAAPCNTTVVSSEVCSYSSQQTTTTNVDHTCEVVSGQPQLRFRSCLPVSYGVPLGLVKQMDMHAATFEGLSVVPGMPFHPFPPLPPYPNNTQNSAPNTVDSAVIGQPAHVQNRSIAQNSSPNSLISRGASMSALEMPGTDNKLDFRQSRGPNSSGRKYVSPQKWNSSKLGPPWIRNRNNWGFTGNNSRNGMNGAGFEIPGDEFRDWHGRERDMYHQPH